MSAAATPEERTGPGAPGDVFLVASSGHCSGDLDCRGEIIDVFESPAGLCYRVRWRDGRESMLPRGAGAVVPRAAARA